MIFYATAIFQGGFKKSVAAASSGAAGRRDSVLECGRPPPLSHRWLTDAKTAGGCRIPKPRGNFGRAFNWNDAGGIQRKGAKMPGRKVTMLKTWIRRAAACARQTSRPNTRGKDNQILCVFAPLRLCVKSFSAPVRRP
jgi:hypothetical protein